MAKTVWKGGNVLNPVPCVLVTSGSMDTGLSKPPNVGIMTAAWTGTVCSDPPMVYVSIKPERYSYQLVKEYGCFVLNLPTRSLVRAVDYCGVRSQKNENKFASAHLTFSKAQTVCAPLINECPVNLECKVEKVVPLGSHDMFLARVESVSVADYLLDQKGRLNLEKAGLIAYSHGTYYELGRALGTFGFSVRKNHPTKGGSRHGVS